MSLSVVAHRLSCHVVVFAWLTLAVVHDNVEHFSFEEALAIPDDERVMQLGQELHFLNGACKPDTNSSTSRAEAAGRQEVSWK